MSNPNVPNKIYTEEKVKEIKELMKKYIEENSVPIIAEFAYQNKIPRQTIYDLDDLKELLEELKSKKEAQLEKGALANKLNVAMAMLSLKQLGWSDKREVKIQTDDETKEKIKRIFDDKFGGEDSK